MTSEGMQAVCGSAQNADTGETVYVARKTTRARVPNDPTVVGAVADVRCGGAPSGVGEEAEFDGVDDCYFWQLGGQALVSARIAAIERRAHATTALAKATCLIERGYWRDELRRDGRASE